jgi:hypothetical protein
MRQTFASLISMGQYLFDKLVAEFKYCAEARPFIWSQPATSPFGTNRTCWGALTMSAHRGRGSDRPTVKMALMALTGHWPPSDD